jgi:mono/diheme cytochrome c family protein
MSTHTRIDIALLLGTIICVLLTLNSGRDMSRPNVEYMPDMAHSLAYDSFARNPVFANGITLQTPPAGAVARGRLPLRYGSTPEEAQRAGRELTNPLDPGDPEDPDTKQLGASGFGIFCHPCHGATGAGDGPVAMKGFPPPPPLFAEKATRLADGQIFHIISFGQGNMPAHGTQIPPTQRWQIVTHVRKLQARAAEKATADAAAEKAAAEKAAAEPEETTDGEGAGS